MTTYAENSKEFTKALLELINEFSKVTGYKLNIQKLIIYLYTSNGHMKTKIKDTMPLIITIINEILRYESKNTTHSIYMLKITKH